jgi:hypothetical protein
LPGEADLSLGAELLLLSVDPADGGLLPHKRRRMRKALRAAGTTRRRAEKELVEAKLVTGTGPFQRIALVDRSVPGGRFRRLREALAEDTLGDGRDRDLVFLLAWSGVLGARLSAHERRTAARRIRALAQSIDVPARVNVPAASATLSPIILALGIAGVNELIDTPIPGDSGAGDGSFTAGELGGFDVGGGPP